ncbi:putative phosphomutase [Kluyveromyces lactis]|uniref:KLLA0B12628p n=1 Tax=Kluyveromyces lactis (strain ATCC 8585 / CBS 2359 / DSM 70799 / NBRC 1267 / NRRL Y-1140 / WM37) TaxID=284590 RepID=Q6CVE6_KLULA|nr:uncharacterized protein KLLA0_B12628g [Kluyveromyces lactis]CAH02486.1 KLLA0B12628p [Kluyveromyces lactis]|eukprot:XP_452093.1 uncharacterized protein KLLA0_B12628g [Kluyveromyces lactis]
MSRLKYSAVPGYFTSFGDENVLSHRGDEGQHLGFVDGCSGWEDIQRLLDEDSSLKLLVLARHGQGHHNALESKYGTQEWERYWALQPGVHEVTLVDAQLTELGKQQVRSTGKELLLPMVEKIGFPEKFYSSPLRRCLETYMESWGQVFTSELVSSSTEVSVYVKEQCRETLGRHYCDKRLPHDHVVEQYGEETLLGNTKVHWVYEPGMANEDTMWSETHRETVEEIDYRIGGALQELLSGEERYISLTCHSGVIQSALRVLKHPEILQLQTGGVVFVLCKPAETEAKV